MDTINKPRYVIYTSTKDADFLRRENEEFVVIRYSVDYISDIMDRYEFIEIEQKTNDVTNMLTIDEIMDETGATAIHEEGTKGVIIISEEEFKNISNAYHWKEGIYDFLSSMLCVNEKIDIISKKINENTKNIIPLSSCNLIIAGKSVPLQDSYYNIFSDATCFLEYNGYKKEFYWSSQIPFMKIKIYILDSYPFEESDDIYSAYNEKLKNEGGYYENYETDNFNKYR